MSESVSLAHLQEKSINMFWYGKMKYICEMNEAVVRQMPEYLKRKEIRGTRSETVRHSLTVLVLELSEHITESCKYPDYFHYYNLVLYIPENGHPCSTMQTILTTS